MRPVGLIAAVLWISFTACSPGEPPGHETHPKDEYRARPEGVPVAYIDRSATDLTDGQQEIVDRLSIARPIARIGVDEGPTHEVFGEIRDVAIDQDRLYAVDIKYSTVRVFTLEGEFIEAVGGPGQGPGEFFNPTTLAVDDGRGFLLVADVGGRRLHRSSFPRKDGPGGFQFEQNAPLGLVPEDMCRFGDDVLVHGWKLGVLKDGDLRNVRHKVLHLIDQSGNILDSFGSVYESPNRIANSQIHDGPIACDKVGKRVYLAPRDLLGEVRAYDLAGQEPWIAVLRDFSPSILKGIPGGGTRWTADWSTGYSRIEALVSVPGGGRRLSLRIDSERAVSGASSLRNFPEG